MNRWKDKLGAGDTMASKSQTLYFLYGAYYNLAVLTD